jgi:diguanylate cyclase (GGDEF)-like protein
VIKLMNIFRQLPLYLQTCTVVAAATIGADLLTLIFYGIFFEDRLLLDLLLTTVITLCISFPLAYFFLSQQLKLAIMAEMLHQSARTDHLTGLLNRAAFFNDTSSFLRRPEVRGALLYIDADEFKAINDAFGHAAGDAVLKSIAHLVAEERREGDLAARIGGEEIVVLFAGTRPDRAAELAERIRRKVQQTAASASGLPDRAVTVSIGLSIIVPGDTVETLMSRADQNLYRAKELGRNRVVADKADGKVAA